jgi:hypothetical protein
MTKFAKETANIPTTQESSRVEVTSEENVCHFLRYQEYFHFEFTPQGQNSHPSLLCGNTEAVT